MAIKFLLTSEGNRIAISGGLYLKEVKRVLAAIHNITHKSGYEDVVLDFSDCSSAFGPAMLAIAVQAQRYLLNQIDVSLTLPKDGQLRSLFLNSNWAHFIDPQKYAPSSYAGSAQNPAAKFRDGSEQHLVVKAALDRVLSALSGFDRSHLKAIDWSMHEITDNVLTHSQSQVGGFLQVTNFPKSSRVDFVVCDAGVGIPHTLRAGHPEIRSDSEALDRAIREGVTRDPAIGQGNGLYGSYRAARLSGGTFEIFSGMAILEAKDDYVRVEAQAIPFSGTLVAVSIKYEEPLLLEEVLKFGGKSYEPMDHIDLIYEEMEDGLVKFDLASEAAGFGSRAAGVPVRQKLKNLARLCGDKRIAIDLGGVPLVTSSFADEAFAKLFLELGALTFMRTYEFRNVDRTLRGCLKMA